MVLYRIRRYQATKNLQHRQILHPRYHILISKHSTQSISRRAAVRVATVPNLPHDTGTGYLAPAARVPKKAHE